MKKLACPNCGNTVRRASAGVQHAEPTACSGADVEQSSTALECRNNGANRPRDGSFLPADCRLYARLLDEHRVDELRNRPAVQIHRLRIALLGERQTVAMSGSAAGAAPSSRIRGRIACAEFIEASTCAIGDCQ